MKLVVAGSRSIKDKELVFEHIDIFNNDTQIDHIVCGGAKASDMSTILWATKNCVPYTIYLPNYSLYGKIAPLVRNEKMSAYGNELLAFWDCKSRGTQHIIDCFKRLSKPYMVVEVRSKS